MKLNNIAEKIRIFLDRLRSLPDNKKKIILWTIVTVLAIIMVFFWIRGAMNSLSKIGENMQDIEIPQINIPDMPAMPSLDDLQTVTPSNQDLIPSN